MFNWFKNAPLKNKTTETVNPTIASIGDDLVNFGKSTNAKELLISEPITSFLKCFKENPRLRRTPSS